MTVLPDWITDPALRTVWERVRIRFEKAGLVPEGKVRISGLGREERRALGDLLARTITRDTITIDLAELDVRLRGRSGVGGLHAVLLGLGGPPRDRPADRAAGVEARLRPLALAAELVDTPWAPDWIAGLRRTGLLTNREDAEALVRACASVLHELTRPDHDATTRSRVELSAELVGDAHALDRDRLLHRLVLRGLAAAEGIEVPRSTHDRETLWSRFGVEPDLLSRTCLIWRLRSPDARPVARRLNLAAESGDPVHLTEWDLRRLDALGPSWTTRVLVCENPRVVEAMAEKAVPGWSAVCTAGEPNLLVDRVLGALAAGGADLRYHGDFDWPGVAIANRAMARFGAIPWRMTAEDYVGAVRADAPVLGTPTATPAWDHELGAAMRHHDRAVHEESVLAQLIPKLTEGD